MANNKQAAIKLLAEAFTTYIKAKVKSEQKRETLLKLLESLLDPIVPPRMLNITYATIRYWESKSYLLFPTLKEEGEWRKFTTLEYFWVAILKNLTEKGCALEAIVPKLIYAYTRYKGVDGAIKYNPDGEIPVNDKGINSSMVLYFFMHVLAMFEKNGRYTLYILDDGTIQFATDIVLEGIDNINPINNIAYKGAISICISDLVHGFMNQKVEMQNVYRTKPAYQTKEEAEIIKLLRKKELKEVTIKLEDGQPVSLELTEQFDITRADAGKRLAEFLNTQYQEINAVTNGGKTIGIKRTTKQKLK